MIYLLEGELTLVTDKGRLSECPPFGCCWGHTGHRDRAKTERMTHKDVIP
jgi:hypothetical protein